MKNFWLLSLIVLPLFLHAQKDDQIPIKFSKDFEVKVGKPYKVMDSPEKMYYSDGEKLLSVKRVKKDVVLRVFDAEKLTLEHENKFSDLEAGFVIEDLVEVKDKLYLFYEVWDKGNTTEQLYYREIDVKNAKFKDKGKRILAIKGKVTGFYPAFRMIGLAFTINFAGVKDKFDFITSHNNEKLMIQYRKKPEIKRDAVNKDVIGMYAFDSDLNQLFGNEVTMPYTEKKMDNLDYAIDKDGKMYILAKVRKDNSTKEAKKGEVNYDIELLTVEPNSTKVKTKKIELEGKFLNNLWLFESPNDYLVCAGYYCNGVKAIGDVNGVVVCKVSKKNEIYDLKTYEIPLDVLNQYEKEGKQKNNKKKEDKGKADFDDLMLRKLLIGDDGSMVFIGEQHYIKVVTDSKGRKRYIYFYNDMLATKINADGSLAWMQKLPKRQRGGAGQGGMSFKYIYGEETGRHYILFLDNEKNIALPMNKRPAYHVDGLGGFLTGYQIDDQTGKTEKLSILDTRNVQGRKIYQFFPSKITKVNSKEFVFEVYKKQKEDILIKISLK